MRAIVLATERPPFVCVCGVEVRDTMQMLTYSRVPGYRANSGTAEIPCCVKVREEKQIVAKHRKAYCHRRSKVAFTVYERKFGQSLKKVFHLTESFVPKFKH